MIKTINVTGIELDNYTVRESIIKLDKNMSDSGTYIIEEIGMDAIMKASEDEKVKEAFSVFHHTLIADTAILEAAKASSLQRKHEIDNRIFFTELVKRLERNRKRVFLLGSEGEFLHEMNDYLLENFPKLDIVGSYSLEDCQGTVDVVINDINVAMPDIVMSFLPTPDEEYFLLENKDKISTGLWYGMGLRKPNPVKKAAFGFFRHKLRIKALERQIHLYHKHFNSSEQ